MGGIIQALPLFLSLAEHVFSNCYEVSMSMMQIQFTTTSQRKEQFFLQGASERAFWKMLQVNWVLKGR